MKRLNFSIWMVIGGLLLPAGASSMMAQDTHVSADQAQPAGGAPGGQVSADQAAGPSGQLQPYDPSADQTRSGSSATGSSATPSSEPTLKVNPMQALKNLEPDADAEYQIGAGDIISLDFPTRPELSGKKKVGPDGRITLNMAGSIEVANKTRSQAAQAIIAALQPYYTGLTVTVDVDSYGSNRVIVLGNVQHPGVLYFDDTPTLLDVIARAGLMATTAAPSMPGQMTTVSAVTPRDGIPERCAIYRGNDQVVWVNLRMLLQSGNSLADLRLKRNDIVFIPSQQEAFVSVLGSVDHPGAIALTPQSTLVSVIAQAGGMKEGAAEGRIQIVQPSTGKTTTVSYKQILSLHGSDEIQLHAGDVIYVPQSRYYKSTYVFERLSPIFSLGSIAAIAAVQ